MRKPPSAGAGASRPETSCFTARSPVTSTVSLSAARSYSISRVHGSRRLHWTSGAAWIRTASCASPPGTRVRRSRRCASCHTLLRPHWTNGRTSLRASFRSGTTCGCEAGHANADWRRRASRAAFGRSTASPIALSRTGARTRRMASLLPERAAAGTDCIGPGILRPGAYDARRNRAYRCVSAVVATQVK